MPSDPAAHPVVRIHPARAELLARALTEAAATLSASSVRVGDLLVRHGDTLRPAIDLGRASARLSEEAVGVHRLVAAVHAWQAEGRVPRGVAVLRGPVVGVHRDPASSVLAARLAVAAYERGDRVAFTALALDRVDDPVFASTILVRVGVDRLVTELDLFGYSWGAPAADERGALVGALAALLATTTRSGTPAFSAARLADEARAQEVPLAVIGLLFARCQRWGAGFVASVVDRVVVPINRDILGGHDPSVASFGFGEGQVDGRVLILQAAASDPAAARGAVAGSDLDALLETEVGYLDEGDAAGRMLVVATRPVSDDHLVTLPPMVVRVVEAVNALDAPSPAVRDQLGEVAAPWIEGFGSDAFGGLGLPDPLPDLDGVAAGRFLEVAMGSSAARADIETATWSWAAATFAVLGRTPDPVSAKRVADVVRAVTDAGNRAEAARLASADAVDAHNRAMWNLAISVAAGTVPVGPVGGAVLSGAATVVGGRLVEAAIPEVARETDFLRDVPATVADDQRALEYLALAVLWDRRTSNGLFAPSPDTPRLAGQAGSLEGTPLLDADGRLRAYPTLSADDRATFDRWLLTEGRRGATVVSLVDAVGEEFGKSGDDPR